MISTQMVNGYSKILEVMFSWKQYTPTQQPTQHLHFKKVNIIFIFKKSKYLLSTKYNIIILN